MLCPAGYWCVGNLMVACEAGRSSVTGQSVCTACAQGSFAALSGALQCTTCPAGTQINQSFSSTEFNDLIPRAVLAPGTGKLYIMRTPLVASQGAMLTKWSFYAATPCPVTPIIFTANVQAGSTGAATFTVSQVGTTRSVNGGEVFAFDFLQGVPYPIAVPQAAGLGYYYYQFLGWPSQTRPASPTTRHRSMPPPPMCWRPPAGPRPR